MNTLDAVQMGSRASPAKRAAGGEEEQRNERKEPPAGRPQPRAQRSGSRLEAKKRPDRRMGDRLRLPIALRAFQSWCGYGDSNPNASPHENLTLACLPIPSYPHSAAGNSPPLFAFTRPGWQNSRPASPPGAAVPPSHPPSVAAPPSAACRCSCSPWRTRGRRRRG